MTDKLAQLIVDTFEIAAALTIYFLTELAWWIYGRLINIPASEWD